MEFRTSVNLSPATRDRLNEVRKALAAVQQRPLGHITHDEAMRFLLDQLDQAAKQEAAQ
jgi:hypothetical protein